MRIALLGPLVVIEDDGTVVEVAGPKVMVLLALLALRPGRAVPADRLVDGIWGEEPPANAANALQTLVKRLRAACGPASVLARGGGYALEVAPDDVDVTRFLARVAQAGRYAAAGDSDGDGDRAAAEELTLALGEWSGPEALSGLRGWPGLGAVAADLDEARLAAVEMLADRRRSSGRAAESIGMLSAEAAAHPLRESVTARLMVALAEAGRRSEALTVFHRTRELLVEELGVGPGVELAAAYAEVLSREREQAFELVGASNLPRTQGSFIGREEEIGVISALLDATALVTLVGPGGTGKTRLAVECAGRLGGGYADGVWLVELAGVTDPALFGGTVLAAIGIRENEGPESDGARAVAEALAGRRMLVVLDNCEHLLAAAAELVHEVGIRCPGVRVLATSREPLDVPGEHVLAVPALGLAVMGAGVAEASESAAVRLFVERAAKVRAGFRLDAENCAAVCAVCRELDGIPLALELAAGRMRAMSPGDLAAGLGPGSPDRFGVLGSGRRAARPGIGRCGRSSSGGGGC
ncbi:BTAD domain-containing putative transcriptional regulator [Catenulispora yoronensis]